MTPPRSRTNSHDTNGDHSTPQPEDDQRQDRLNDAYCELLESRESGGAIDPAIVLARYPDLVPELKRFLASDDAVHRTIEAARPFPGGPGHRIGRFVVSSVIASGPMSVVYQVHDESTPAGPALALKVLPDFGRHNPENRARFEREAEAVSHLNHPNILPIVEFDTSGVEPYILMPFVAGHDLRLVRRRLWQAGNPKSDQQPAAPPPTQSPTLTRRPIAPPSATRIRTHVPLRWWAFRQPAPSTTLISEEFFIVTSSRQTCCSIRKEPSSWPILDWPARWTSQLAI